MILLIPTCQHDEHEPGHPEHVVVTLQLEQHVWSHVVLAHLEYP